MSWPPLLGDRKGGMEEEERKPPDFLSRANKHMVPFFNHALLSLLRGWHFVVIQDLRNAFSLQKGEKMLSVHVVRVSFSPFFSHIVSLVVFLSSSFPSRVPPPPPLSTPILCQDLLCLFLLAVEAKSGWRTKKGEAEKAGLDKLEASLLAQGGRKRERKRVLD